MDRSTQEFIKALKIYKDILPKQTLKTLRGQALSGDLTRKARSQAPS